MSVLKDLQECSAGIQGPYFVGGDFNCVLHSWESSGTVAPLSPDTEEFAKWVDDEGVLDMGFTGSTFTWTTGKTPATYKARRLDRVFMDVSARLDWPNAEVRHLPVLCSDHAPLLLSLNPGAVQNRARRPFRFEAAWTTHASFSQLVKDKWDGEAATPLALLSLRDVLLKWNTDTFGNIYFRKKELLKRLAGIQKACSRGVNQYLIDLEHKLQIELNSVLEQEELLWWQKSRENWLVAGDRNTSFFHISTIVRRRRNRIDGLVDDNDRLVTEKDEVEGLALSYFKGLFSWPTGVRDGGNICSGCFPSIPLDQWQSLANPVLDEEIDQAIKQMGGSKAPGLDGFQPLFFQKCWSVVGSSVRGFVKDFFMTGKLLEGVNETLIVLLAKVAKPEKINQFRPISLCNVIYKVISKVLVNRSRPVLCSLIGPTQGSFLPGRMISDNIVLVQEVVHSMRRKQGRKGWMVLKIDLEKAYDRLDWDFVADTVKDAGFPSCWPDWIAECISTTTTRLLWNGGVTESFKPERGIRQGDPISPYVFILCMERLSHMILNAVNDGGWKPAKLTRNGPDVSHVFFADDVVLVAEASVRQLRFINKLLSDFCKVSGLKVNASKSKMFVSPNVDARTCNNLRQEAEFEVTDNLGSYLGMPVLHSRVTKDTFAPLLDKVKGRLSAWKGKYLSMAGRVALARSVLSSIPIYTMATVSLPSELCEKIDAVVRGFVWGHDTNNRKMHTVAWDTISRPKRIGGLGIRPVKAMNLAVLGKLCWRFLQDDSSLWSKVLKAKYVRQEGVFSGSASYVWQGMKKGFDQVLSAGTKWIVRDGRAVRFWLDPWLDDGCLLDQVITQVDSGDLQRTVRDYWVDEGGWKWSELEGLLPMGVILRLAAIGLVNDSEDALVWKPCADGDFTISSAYELIAQTQCLAGVDSQIYKAIWRVKVQERARLFVWLAISGGVQTNEERRRRHLSNDGTCLLCNREVESLIHLFRDCPKIVGFWYKMQPPACLDGFFDLSFAAWVRANLVSKDKMVDGTEWSAVFCNALWWTWRWRNAVVFDRPVEVLDPVGFVMAATKEYHVAWSARTGCAGIGRNEDLVVMWGKPTDDQVKVNTDGAVSRDGRAAAAGAIRDASGSWLGGFGHNLGICSVPMAELWGVRDGLALAWDKGFRNVWVESDSALAVHLALKLPCSTHPLFSLAKDCQGFLARNWSIRVSHVFREANAVADSLARLAVDFPLGFHFISEPPVDSLSFLFDDAEGRTFPRLARV